MRTMFILRGSPASGKSTWIQNNNLEPYTLSADNIRLMYQSPVLNKNGDYVISQQNDGKVWQFLFQMLEDRMQRGEFVVIDATHYKSELLNRYKNLISKYRYRAFVVDFTNISLEELLERNNNRTAYKKVPEETIRKMCAVFEQDTEVSRRFNVISPQEAIKKLKEDLIYDYSQYEKVVFFGDIHGCYEPIKEYFAKNPMRDDYAYIFLGDYIDRGIQNKEVLEFLISIKDKRNVLLLEGNHEIHLRKYADEEGAEKDISKEDAQIIKKYCGKNTLYELNKNKIRSDVFKNKTIPEIAEIDKKELRQLCRKFGQMAYIKFKGNEYFACHGGIPNIPTIFTSTEELIKGVGKYEDVESIYESFEINTKPTTVLVHGHRNVFDLPAKNGNRKQCINLCTNIERGANLRILEVDDYGMNIVEVPNTVYDKECFKIQEKVDILPTKSENELLEQLNNSRLVQKKILDGGIVSYNFKHNVFHNRLWNDLTCKARGLFVDAKTEKIIARSYDKFFNWGELDSVKSENLKKTLAFPVTAYTKENGFLAMVSYNWNTDDLLVCSKSTNDGDFVGFIKEELNKLSKSQIEQIKELCKTHNATMVFECINQDKDPHIIKYDSNKLVLLDFVFNEFEFKKADYTLLKFIGDQISVEIKKIAYTFDNWEDLYAFKKAQDNSYQTQYEGWVFEDSNGFMVKYKTRFYKFWKQMRAVKERLQQGNNVKKIFATEDEVRVFNLLKSLNEENKLIDMSIIDVENIYYQQHPELVSTIDK